jgi:hypothetical protein
MKPQPEIRTLFILGAGASRAAGAPLMFDFMESAAKTHRRKESAWAQESFDCVINARRKLQVAYAKSSVDLDNIENLFSTFEMASLVGRLGGLPKDLVETLPNHLRSVIMRTLEQTILYPITGREGIVPSPYPYDEFAHLLLALSRVNELAPLAVMSFNYDLCLEYALLRAGLHPEYALGHAPPTDKGSIPMYKVHGSLNWCRKEDTRTIEASPVRPLQMRTYWERYGLNKPRDFPVDTMELLYGPTEWGAAIHPRPVIVPPTWNKGVYQEMLKPVWREASAALASAENIFVIGYSLPPSDQFFRSFYSLSTISDSIIERFWIFDPSESNEVADRFRSMLGPAVRERNKFKCERSSFVDAINHLADTFGFEPTNVGGRNEPLRAQIAR